MFEKYTWWDHCKKERNIYEKTKKKSNILLNIKFTTYPRCWRAHGDFSLGDLTCDDSSLVLTADANPRLNSLTWESVKSKLNDGWNSLDCYLSF